MKNKTIEYFIQFIKLSKKLSEKEKIVLIQRANNKTFKQISDQLDKKSIECYRVIELKALFRLFGFLIIREGEIRKSCFFRN